MSCGRQAARVYVVTCGDHQFIETFIDNTSWTTSANSPLAEAATSLPAWRAQTTHLSPTVDGWSLSVRPSPIAPGSRAGPAPPPLRALAALQCLCTFRRQFTAARHGRRPHEQTPQVQTR